VTDVSIVRVNDIKQDYAGWYHVLHILQFERKYSYECSFDPIKTLLPVYPISMSTKHLIIGLLKLGS
jgi:hypothetical protein